MAETSRRDPDDFLRGRYDALWAESRGRIESGEIGIDPVLARREVDRRRGMTLQFHPAAEVRNRVVALLEELRELEPEQHYYHAAELHVTFLSLFTATEEHEALFARTEEYVATIGSCLSRLIPFPMGFAGVTASPAAILVQGFTDSRALNEARDALRRELHARGFGHGLDGRYRLETAHMTAARFRAPLRDGKRFTEALERMRAKDFGACEVTSLDLVKSDWYMSRGTAEYLHRYQAPAPAQ